MLGSCWIIYISSSQFHSFPQILTREPLNHFIALFPSLRIVSQNLKISAEKNQRNLYFLIPFLLDSQTDWVETFMSMIISEIFDAVKGLLKLETLVFVKNTKIIYFYIYYQIIWYAVIYRRIYLILRYMYFM